MMNIEFKAYDNDFRYSHSAVVNIGRYHFVKFVSQLTNPDEYAKSGVLRIYSDISLIQTTLYGTNILYSECFTDTFSFKMHGMPKSKAVYLFKYGNSITSADVTYEKTIHFYKRRINDWVMKVVDDYRLYTKDIIMTLLDDKLVFQYLTCKKNGEYSIRIVDRDFVFKNTGTDGLVYSFNLTVDDSKFKLSYHKNDLKERLSEYILDFVINIKHEEMEKNEIKNDVCDCGTQANEVSGLTIKKNKVTQEDVDNEIADIQVKTLDDFGKPTTYVAVILKNGFTMREATTCVDPDNYDETIGADICLKRIKEKIWFLLGYKLQQELYEAQDIDTEDGEAATDNNWDENVTTNTVFSPFVQRMMNEQSELSFSISKLHSFINENDNFKCLPENEQELLNEQYTHMTNYHQVLCRRLDIYINKETGKPLSEWWFEC